MFLAFKRCNKHIVGSRGSNGGLAEFSSSHLLLGVASWARPHVLVVAHELMDDCVFGSLVGGGSAPRCRALPLERDVIALRWLKHHVLFVHTQFEPRWTLLLRH